MSATPTAEVPAVEIRDLRVDYGEFIAVDDVSLSIPRGEVFGLVGPNGAGKTSTFRVVTTLMEPTYGDVFLDGIDIQEDIPGARRILGYMPDLAPVPSDLKVWEFLEFHAAAHGIKNRARRRERVDECLAEVAMDGERDKWCKTLSRGQTQRVVLAKTMLHRPSVLVLDEPASGLDPLSRRNLRHTLRKLAAGGTTVFISSHILSELAEMCTSLCVMSHGRLLASGTADEVRRQLGADARSLTVTFLAGIDEALGWLAAHDGVHSVERSGGRLVFGFTGSDEAQADLMAGLVTLGCRMRSFEEKRSTFEDILVEVAENHRRP